MPPQTCSRSAMHATARPSPACPRTSTIARRSRRYGAWTNAPERAAIRNGELVGYLLGAHRDVESWGSNIWVEYAGHAVREPELVRDLYAAAAEGWVAQGRNAHYALVPATDPELVDAWFRLSFGAQHAAGIQETPAVVDNSPSDVIARRATAEDLEAGTALDLELPRHQERSPVFSMAAPTAITDEDREQFLSEVDDPEVGLFLAEIDGKPVGELLMVPVERSSMHVGLARPDGRPS